MSYVEQNRLGSSSAGNANAGRGWQAQLDLSFESRGGDTVLTGRRHIGPLVVQRPFYPEAGACHVYVVHPPGGIVAGDELSLRATVQPAAHALITTPAAGKFYRSEGPTARLMQEFTVQGGRLEWLPQENIYYPEALAEVGTHVHLEGTARFVGWEISCFGLTARAQPFCAGELRQGLELRVDGELVLCEHQTVNCDVIEARWGTAGNASVGTLVAFPAGTLDLRAARSVQQDDVLLSCTLVDGSMICRAIAPRADRLRRAFVAVWTAIRPLLMGCAAVPPRVWAT